MRELCDIGKTLAKFNHVFMIFQVPNRYFGVYTSSSMYLDGIYVYIKM